MPEKGPYRAISLRSATLKTRENVPRILVIACGALAREVRFLTEANGWSEWCVRSLPAELHNTPARIVDAVRERITQEREAFDHVFCAYADCGTGGKLDALLAEEGIERLPGAHCYQFYSGDALFEELTRESMGTFYLTDFLCEHFDRLVVRGLGLDRHPELRDEYFRGYERLVYLSQRAEPGDLITRAEAAAKKLGLAFEHRAVGYGQLETSLQRLARAAEDR